MKEQTKTKFAKKQSKNWALGATMGVMFAVVFGLLIFDNMVSGLIFGIGIGLAFSTIINKPDSRQN